MSKRPNRKPLPQQPVEAQIESFTHDGRGVAHVAGKAVFISGALPGESVRFAYSSMRRDFAEGRTVEVISASPQRVEPRCLHFSLCGGCSLQHLAEEAQIHEKQQLLLDQFRRLGKVEPQALFTPLVGPHWGYRHKARLGVKWVPKKNKVLVGFREKGSALIAEIDRCVVLHPSVGERLQDIANMIAQLSIRDRLPQIEVAVSDARAALVLRTLEPPSPEDLEVVIAFGKRFGFDIHLQPGGPETVYPIYPENPPPLSYALPDQHIDFRFRPTDFTQVNVQINRQMVTRVLEIVQPQAEDRILDLFCGIGNFTLPLARLAQFAVGVEGGREAVERARENARDNDLNNVEFHVADLTQMQDHVPWAHHRYDKVLLDPSRAGAQEILAYVPKWQARRIVYVSCNPSTLARDAGILVHQHGYRLMQAGVMDMFPNTAHVESIALFER